MGFLFIQVLKLLNVNLPFGGINSTIIRIIIVVLFALIFFLTSGAVLRGFESFQTLLEKELKEKSLQELTYGIGGLIIGLLVSFLLTQPLSLIPIPYLGVALSILIYVMFSYLGVRLSYHNKEEIGEKLKELRAPKKKTDTMKLPKVKGVPKIVDTSVIIDGRIKDIVEAHFIEGPLIIPVFVLEELQFIADSSDHLKRNRGRRGLDIVKALQENKEIDVLISDLKYDDIKEVDSKLLKLTQDLKGRIITNDYNLNKVAGLQKIPVLNINDLANALRPIYLPGETLNVLIVKAGKELNQGLGYLDDGTMIVVETGKDFIGKIIKVEVTSVLQTSAGKMIFAKPKAYH